MLCIQNLIQIQFYPLSHNLTSFPFMQYPFFHSSLTLSLFELPLKPSFLSLGSPQTFILPW